MIPLTEPTNIIYDLIGSPGKRQILFASTIRTWFQHNAIKTKQMMCFNESIHLMIIITGCYIKQEVEQREA